MTIFLNEKPVTLDWCNVGLCDWSKFKQRFERFANADCSQIFCTENSGNSVSVKYGFLSALLAVVALRWLY